jgi:hypothetical protein
VTARDVYTTSDTQIAFTMLIEGYDVVLTTWPHTAAVTTAYAGTEWSSATVIRGLQVPSDLEQKISIWSLNIDTPSARFVLHPDDGDTFGVVAHRSANTAGFETYLSAELANTGTTVTVKDTSTFPSSGTIHIGTEEITYSGKTSTTFTGATRGRRAPFKANTEANQRFGRRHQLTRIQGIDHLPRVNSYRRSWVGRTVRVLAHTVQGSGPASTSVLDTFANAETIFEGTIEAMDESESGATVIDCVHYNQRVSDTMLLANQWRGHVDEGFYCHTGLYIQITELAIATGSLLTARVDFVVSGTPPGSISAGVYTAAEICSFINDEIAASSFVGAVTCHLISTAGGTRTRITASGYSVSQEIILRWGTSDLGNFMGFIGEPNRVGIVTSSSESVTSDGVPLRVMAYRSDFFSIRLNLVQESGAFFTGPPEAFLPQVLKGQGAGTYYLLDVGGVLLYVQRNTDTIVSVIYLPELRDALGGGELTQTFGRLTVDESGTIDVRQIAIIEGELKQVLLRILASTGDVSYNHIAYDEFDAQLGAAIPWEIMQDLENTLTAIQASYGSAKVSIMLDQPLKLEKLLAPELALRGYYLITDNGRFRLVSPSTPGASADYTLTTSSKAGASGADDSQRTSGGMTNEFIKTKLTVKYNRTYKGEYLNTRTIVNLAARSDYGQDYPMTVEARNTRGSDPGLIESLMARLGDIVLGRFAYPLKRVSRTISRRFFHIRPGATVSLTDDSIRDPRTGVRGLSNYPCWVEKVQTDWSTGIGTVSLIMQAGDDATRYGVYSPAAKMASYSAGPKELTAVANEFTFAGTAQSPDASHFEVGDKIRIIEESPASPASPSTFTDTVAARSGNVITLTTGFSPVGGTTYYVTSDDRAAAQLSQRSDTYLADDVDNQIQNAAPSNFWGFSMPLLLGQPASDNTLRFRFPSDLTDDEGEPVSTFLHTTALVNLNNLVNRRTAISCPDLAGHGSTWLQSYTSADSAVYRLVGVRPVAMGRGLFASRYLYLAPHFYRGSGSGTVRVRYTLSPFLPVDSGNANPRDDVVFTAPYVQVEWLSTATVPTYATRGPMQTVGHFNSQQGIPGIFCVELRAVSGETINHLAVGEAWQGPLED